MENKELEGLKPEQLKVNVSFAKSEINEICVFENKSVEEYLIDLVKKQIVEESDGKLQMDEFYLVNWNETICVLKNGKIITLPIDESESTYRVVGTVKYKTI